MAITSPSSSTHVVCEAEAVRAVVVHVDVAGPPMRFELEVMMLDVRDTVTHFALACRNFALPDDAPGALDRDAARHECRNRDRPRARGRARTCGASIPRGSGSCASRTCDRKTRCRSPCRYGAGDPPHRSRTRRRSPPLRRHLPRIPARAVPRRARAARCRCLCRTTRAPLRSGSGPGRPPSRPQRNIRMLSVRFVSLLFRMHLVAARGAAEMRETGPAHETPRRLGMIDRHQQTPRRRASVNRIVVERLATSRAARPAPAATCRLRSRSPRAPAQSRRPRAGEATAPRRERRAVSNRACS